MGPSKVQLALIQYSTEPSTEFLLNTYSVKDDVMSHLSNVKLKGGFKVNTGVALDYVKNNVFTASSGSRAQQGVPQILILLSGTKSDDDVLGPVDRVRKAGIDLFTVGLNNTGRLEMEIERSSSNVNRDIVFLIDGSDDVRSRFSSIREFVAKLVEGFDLDKGKDKVAVVQYSNNAELNFNLNTYNTRNDVLKHVASLKPKGGRPQYIGAALQFVKDKVFVSNAGSRHHEGAKQILVMLAGGRSRDSPRGPASMLKAAGVVTFAVGSRSSNSAELQIISSDPNNAYSITNFENLPEIQQRLMNQITQEGVEKEIKAGRDIVFLLDGSDNTRNTFSEIQNFLYKVIDRFDIGPKKDRVAVIQFSNVALANFFLNSFMRKEDVLTAVRRLSHKGGRPLKIGAALQYVKDNIFTVPTGSRHTENVRQILILLSSGPSSDSVSLPSASLRESNVTILTIGTKRSDYKEMGEITNRAILGCSLCIGFHYLSSCLFSVDTAQKDIVFLLDGSDGTRNGFPAMRDFVEKVVEKLNVGENKDRVSVVQYSRDANVNFYLNTYTRKEDIVDSIRGLKHKGGRPLNTGAALQYVRDNVFTDSSGSRRLQGVPQMLVLLNGGRSFDSVDAPASALKQQGIYVIGIGTGGSDSKELQKISYQPNLALSVSDYSDLPTVQEQLSSAMSTVLLRATPVTPTVTGKKLNTCLKCDCFLVEKRLPGRDIVFLLDGSDDTRTGFPAMRDFVQRVVETLSVDDSTDRVSVVQYSRDPTVQFYLNTYTTKGEILDTLRDLRPKGGRPLNTGAALQYLRDNVFTASAGSRRLEGVPQILILLSGGRSFDRVEEPASALKQLGVLTFAIGSRSSDSRELQSISHDRSYALSVSEFTDLPKVQQQLQSSVEAVVSKVTPETPTVLGIQAPIDTAQKDIVFLLDGSDGTRNGFPAMRDFVEKVTLSVDDSTDRVSVVQYSRDPTVQFYLNTYTTKGEILDTLRDLRPKGGRPLNTGAALQYLRDNVFTASAGSRRLEGVPQILILLSGGRSFDRVEEPASALKQLGVLTFAIGSRSSDSRELQSISHDRSYALSVSEFTDLPKVQQQLQSSVEAVVSKVTPETPTDIVFLLDGSDGTRNGFPAMRDFVEKVVEKLNVGENKDRASVVQYSRDANVNFYLNTYTRKEDIVDSIRGLKHKGGRPLNTGAALQYVRDNVFTDSSGSRRLQGVPQMLVLLNGGRSFDSVDAPASALKQQGIYVIGIGTGGSDSKELQKISYQPNLALSVSDYSDLPTVQEQLSSAMSTVLLRATPVTPTVTGKKVTKYLSISS
uniref:Collagen, type VI, alpha 3 n=1 Tax=Echeneis naucrates TaxID=173247 RepID=A0A665UW50_ECHNA